MAKEHEVPGVVVCLTLPAKSYQLGKAVLKNYVSGVSGYLSRNSHN